MCGGLFFVVWLPGGGPRLDFGEQAAQRGVARRVIADAAARGASLGAQQTLQRRAAIRSRRA
ncbi:hypothetical protein ACFSKM_18045 [Ancylobacter dichloromethanicus]